MSPISPTSPDAVSVTPFREHYLRATERGDFNASEIAERLGWVRPNGSGDSTRVLRALGVRPETARRGGAPKYRSYMRYEMATKLCRALGMDPVDADV